MLGGGFQLKQFKNVRPYPWGFPIQFDGSHIFQMGWLKPPTSYEEAPKIANNQNF